MRLTASLNCSKSLTLKWTGEEIAMAAAPVPLEIVAVTQSTGDSRLSPQNSGTGGVFGIATLHNSN